MADNSAGETENHHTVSIIDCSGLSLSKLAKLPDSVLINALNRVLGDVNSPDDVVFAGFNASI